jgi:hypothetical protein
MCFLFVSLQAQNTHFLSRDTMTNNLKTKSDVPYEYSWENVEDVEYKFDTLGGVCFFSLVC